MLLSSSTLFLAISLFSHAAQASAHLPSDHHLRLAHASRGSNQSGTLLKRVRDGPEPIKEPPKKEEPNHVAFDPVSGQDGAHNGQPAVVSNDDVPPPPGPGRPQNQQDGQANQPANNGRGDQQQRQQGQNPPLQVAVQGDIPQDRQEAVQSVFALDRADLDELYANRQSSSGGSASQYSDEPVLYNDRQPVEPMTTKQQISEIWKRIETRREMQENGELEGISTARQMQWEAAQRARMLGLRFKQVGELIAEYPKTSIFIAGIVGSGIFGIVEATKPASAPAPAAGTDLTMVPYDQVMVLPAGSVLAGNDSTTCTITVELGSITPDMVLSYDASLYSVTGSLTIEADLQLVCADATTSDGEKSTNEQLIVQTGNTGYGSLLAADATVITTSAGMLSFKYKSVYTDLKLGTMNYGQSTAVSFCDNCIPVTTFAPADNTAFAEQPSFALSLSPSFYLSGLPSDLFLSWTFSNIYSYVPQWDKLPPYGATAQCPSSLPLKETQSQIVANLVDSTGQGAVTLLEPIGLDNSDCAPFTGDNVPSLVSASQSASSRSAAPLQAASSASGIPSAAPFAPAHSKRTFLDALKRTRPGSPDSVHGARRGKRWEFFKSRRPAERPAEAKIEHSSEEETKKKAGDFNDPGAKAHGGTKAQVDIGSMPKADGAPANGNIEAYRPGAEKAGPKKAPDSANVVKKGSDLSQASTRQLVVNLEQVGQAVLDHPPEPGTATSETYQPPAKPKKTRWQTMKQLYQTTQQAQDIYHKGGYLTHEMLAKIQLKCVGRIVATALHLDLAWNNKLVSTVVGASIGAGVYLYKKSKSKEPVRKQRRRVNDPATTIVAFAEATQIPGDSVVAGDLASGCSMTISSGSLSPNLQITYTDMLLTATGSLSVDAKLSLACEDADELQETKETLLLDVSDGYGSALAVDTLVTSNSSGLLQFDYHADYTNLIFGVSGLDTASPAGYCISCFPDITVSRPASTAFDMPPSVVFSLVPSFWVTGVDGSNIAITLQNTYSLTPAGSELPPYGVADRCSDAARPLLQSQGQIVANIVSADAKTGQAVSISGMGSDYHDCDGVAA